MSTSTGPVFSLGYLSYELVTTQGRFEVPHDTTDEIRKQQDRAPRLENARLDAAHVEQALNELGKFVGLDVDELGQAPSRSRLLIWMPASDKVDDEALMDASGARRSWDTAATRVLASRATSSVSEARSASSCSWARSTASAI